MNLRFSIALVALLFLISSCHKQPLSQSQDGTQNKTSLATLEEFHQRGGLPNFFRKVNEGKEVKVAYIGGSITEASEGWRSLTYNWLRINYPHTPFTEINATIGGTGSGLGVFRIERDVLEKEPDLVFVEFAVNDSGQEPEYLYRTMEGIVRKTWKSNPSTDICFVYTVAENVFGDLLEGHYQRSAQAMEVIAEYYQIPSIHMGVQVARLSQEGKLVFTGKPEENPDKIVFTSDRTHPLSKSGHPIYASVVKKYFEKMDGAAQPGPHPLPTPYIADNWETAQMITLPEPSSSTHWERLPEGNAIAGDFAKFMPSIYRATAPDATLHIKFKGTKLGFYDIIGPASSMLDVTVDGEKKQVQRFDQWSNYYRKGNFYVDDLKDGIHEVTVRVPGREFDKATILKKRKIEITDPSLYAENGWYLSNIMILGDLLSFRWE